MRPPAPASKPSAYLRVLEGGCSIPSFALATHTDEVVTLRCGLISLDGVQLVRAEGAVPLAEAATLGERLAGEILEAGGREILAGIRGARD